MFPDLYVIRCNVIGSRSAIELDETRGTNMKTLMVTGVLALSAAGALGGDVNPGVIFGSGNANGSFTIGTGSGVEIGLRAKTRYNSSGAPENTFNWDGGNTYTFDPANGNPPADRAMWNFEWSINTDVNGDSGNDLSDFFYELALFKVDADGSDLSDAFVFDPINTLYADHSIGDNTTTSATDSVAGDPISYLSLISSNNVAQNSWNYGFFNGVGTGALEGIDPSLAGKYIIRLTAFNMDGAVASSEILVNVVPIPPAAFAGLGLLGGLVGVRAIRRR